MATNSNNNDERQPLLKSNTQNDEEGLIKPGSSSNFTPGADIDEHEREHEYEQEEVPVVKEADTEWTKTSIAWYSGFTVLGLVVLGLLIGGLIRSGNLDFDLGGALKKALGGGLSGAAAMVLQVLTLMPLRTIMNYQYRYGTTTTTALNTLYHDGGFKRYYQGLLPALIQGPVSRFGDTAANTGVLALLESNPYTNEFPPLVKSIFASITAALFRIVLTPIDTVKTTLQTQGKPGLRILRNRIVRYGPGTLWYGALATAAATFVGHYPWFGTYNYLQTHLPLPQTAIQKLLRQALIGFISSIISDTSSNSLRVLKTYRQVNETKIGYLNAAKAVIAVDGFKGLFGRGLKVRILANGLQGVMFSVLWRFFMDLYSKK